jgi:hypothetical protein
MISSQMSDKKARERFYLESFLDEANLNAAIESEGSDNGTEPDFFLNLNGERVGIELTELFSDGDRQNERGSASKIGEMRRLRTLARLKGEYDKKCGVPINVQIVSHVPKDEATLLGGLIQSAPMLADWGQARLIGETPAYIRRLPLSICEKAAWSFIGDSVGFFRNISVSLLEARIAPKRKKLPLYRNSVDRVHLLLYANRTLQSGRIHTMGEIPSVDIGGFEAVYVYLCPGIVEKIGAAA